MRLLHAPPLEGYFEMSLYNATLHVSSATINDDMYSELLVYLGTRLNDNRSVQLSCLTSANTVHQWLLAVLYSCCSQPANVLQVQLISSNFINIDK